MNNPHPAGSVEYEEYMKAKFEAQFKRFYLTEERQNIYVACEDLDFTWDERDLPTVERMWNSGVSLGFIAHTFKRDPDEVALLIIDRVKQGFLKARKGGVYGRFKREVEA